MIRFRHYMALTAPLILCAVACLAGPKQSARISAQDLRQLVVARPDSVLRVLNEMESGAIAALPSYEISLLRGLAYNEKRMFSLVEKYAQETLADDSIESYQKVKLNALTLLATARRYYGRYAESIETLTEAIKIARKTGNEAGEYNILTTMAETSFDMGDRKQGYRYLDRIIEKGSSSDDIRILANVSSAYGVKVVELYADDKFEEGLGEGKKRLQLIDRIEKIGGSPEGYTDQQRAYTYARIASCAVRAGRMGEAADAYNSFMATDYAADPVGRAYIMDYLMDAGQWNRVVEFTKPLFPIFTESDTINQDYASLLECNARASAGLGDYRRAYGFARRVAAVNDSLKIRENINRAQELATLFSMNEKDLELANAKADSQRKHILMISAFGVALLVLIILLLVARAYRITKRQQRLATEHIDSMIALNKIESASASTDEDEAHREFMDMQQRIIDSGIFSDPNYNRDKLVECSGMSRAAALSLIEKYAGMTPGDYINKLRVEHSVVLIQEHPDWTIDAVAEECGFISRATYYRHFKRIFGITPAQYRKGKVEEAGKQID